MYQYNFTYQTKNLINSKTYIGVHSTDNMNDHYIGGGIFRQNDAKSETMLLHKAVRKYGYVNFKCIPLCFFDTTEEAYEEEVWLIDSKWIKNPNTYNTASGGSGGNTRRFFTEEQMKEYSKKLSIANTGKKRSPRSEEWISNLKIAHSKYIVSTPFGDFLGYEAAAEVLGINYHTIRARCSYTSDKWKDWKSTKIEK